MKYNDFTISFQFHWNTPMIKLLLFLKLEIWLGKNKISLFFMIISVLVNGNLNISILYFVLWNHLKLLSYVCGFIGKNFHREKIHTEFLLLKWKSDNTFLIHCVVALAIKIGWLFITFSFPIVHSWSLSSLYRCYIIREYFNYVKYPRLKQESKADDAKYIWAFHIFKLFLSIFDFAFFFSHSKLSLTLIFILLDFLAPSNHIL